MPGVAWLQARRVPTALAIALVVTLTFAGMALLITVATQSINEIRLAFPRYVQRYAEVVRWTPLRPLIRRPTGGGLVPHDADWTYSLVIPAGHAWYALRAIQSYQRVHEWLRDALVSLGVDTALSSGSRTQDPGQCFVGSEPFDLLWNGTKVAGAAQRRTRTGLLIQGSVQPPPIALAKADWQTAMLHAAEEAWNARWRPLDLDSSWRQQAETLAAEKYDTDAYNQRR